MPTTAGALTIERLSARSLHNLSITLPLHALVGLSGPSGAGKSTLLQALSAESALREALIRALERGQPLIQTDHRVHTGVVTGLPRCVLIDHASRIDSRHTIASYLGIDRALYTILRSQQTFRCAACKSGVVSVQRDTDLMSSLRRSPSERLIVISCILPPRHTPEFISVAQQLEHLGFSLGVEGERIASLSPLIDSSGGASETPPEVVIDRCALTAANEGRVIDALRTAITISSRAATIRFLRDPRTIETNLPPVMFHPRGTCSSCGSVPSALSEAQCDLRTNQEEGIYQYVIAERRAAPADLAALLNRPILSGYSVNQLLTSELDSLSLPPGHNDTRIEETSLVDRIRTLVRFGLGHLNCLRTMASLSAGERQRVRLAEELYAQRRGTLYAVDEPAIGLHPRDVPGIVDHLMELVRIGNSVLVADSSLQLARACSVTFALKASQITPTVLPHIPSIQRGNPQSLDPSEPSLVLKDLHRNNLKIAHLCIPLTKLVGVCGVSGSGKTTLVMGEIASRIAEGDTTSGIPRRQVLIDRAQLVSHSTPTLGSYCGVIAMLREFYAGLPLSRARGYSARSFSSPRKGSPRCTHCAGGEHDTECRRCGGTELPADVLHVLWHGKSFAELLSLTIVESIELISKLPGAGRILRQLIELGLGHFTLLRRLHSVSFGELQRIKLASKIGSSTTTSIYLIDEPCAGLPPPEVELVVNALRALKQQGHSLVVIEHNPFFLNQCDWLIELGPGAGSRGGTVVFEGAPGKT